jgi:hypothetical protein
MHAEHTSATTAGHTVSPPPRHYLVECIVVKSIVLSLVMLLGITSNTATLGAATTLGKTVVVSSYATCDWLWRISQSHI